MKRKFTLLMTLLLMTIVGWAQERNVTGVVTSAEDDLPIPGVTVVLKGTTIDTVTDTEGRYSLQNVSVDETIVFSYIGMRPQEIRFYVDNSNYYTYHPDTYNNDTWPFNQEMFIILNVAVGGTWGGAQGVDDGIFPQSMEVDYVRVYQKN